VAFDARVSSRKIHIKAEPESEKSKRRREIRLTVPLGKFAWPKDWYAQPLFAV
jgi:hypothetical protein